MPIAPTRMALVQTRYFSETLQLRTSLHALLPQTWKRPLKVLWLLHGMSDDDTIWLRQTSLERYVEPLEIAVIMPAAERSYYTDMKEGLPWFSHFTEELPALVKSLFPLSDNPRDHFLCGLSMGGYGAMKWALTHPGRFAAVASLSGALDPTFVADQKPERRAEFRRIFGDLENFHGSAGDVFHLAQQHHRNRRRLPKIFLSCGTEDYLHPVNQRFHELLARQGIPHEHRFSRGDHEWGYWDAMLPHVLSWLKPILEEPQSALPVHSSVSTPMLS